MRVITLFVFLSFITSISSFSQDTLALKKKTHNPKVATYLSTVLPGAGQVYNKKAWKLAIIYGGFGACYYLYDKNNTEYKKYYNELSYRNFHNDTLTLNFNNLYSNAALTAEKDYYKRNRDLSIIVAGLIYVLNIVDATVDGHLYDFDVSDDLSLKLNPKFEYIGLGRETIFYNSLSLKLKF